MKKAVMSALALAWLIWPIGTEGAQSARAQIANTPVRGSADLASPVIGILREGDLVDVVDRQGDWYRVLVPGEPRLVGYVLARLIEISGAGTAAPGRTSVATSPPENRPAGRPVTQDFELPPAPRPAAANQPVARSQHEKTRAITIRGYVTNVTSPTQFDIEDYRITRDAAFALDFDNANPELKFNPTDIRIGVELEIKGQFDEDSGVLKAKSVRVDMEQFKKQKQTATLAAPPHGVAHTSGGWTGTFLVDGQRVQVTTRTEVVFKLTDHEKGLLKRHTTKNGDADEEQFRSLTTLDEITTGMIVSYEGARSIEDGSIRADRVEFMHNELEKGEKRIWDSLKLELTAFNVAQLRPGELKIANVGKFKTLPDPDVQDYVTQLGRRLVPQYQAEMAETDQNRIPFRFYVVDKKEPNAFATPNGIVVIHSGLFNIVENEAQLAAIVGHEISHAVQEHTWRQQQYHKNARMALQIGAVIAAAYGQNGLRDLATMVEGAVRNGYARNLENQADRMGLEYMVHAGYDPREAPRVWKLMATKLGDAPTNFFWSNHDNDATRRSYLMNELKNNYSGLDYSKLATNEAAFTAMADKVRAASGAKRKIKVS